MQQDPTYQPMDPMYVEAALLKALQRSAAWFLAEGGDWADDMLALGDYNCKVKNVRGGKFTIEAKPLDEFGEPLRKPAIKYQVTLKKVS